MEINTNLASYNKNTTCRICMQDTSTDLFPIFNEVFFGDNHNPITIAEIITECTSYPVAHNDQLPAQICNNCVKAARNALSFKRQTEKAYCQLKALYDITWIPKKEAGSGGGISINRRVRSLTTDRYTQTDKSSVFQCECCPKKFFDESELRQHRALFHIYDGKKCRVCGETFNHLGQLKVHLSTEHPSEGIRCPFKCNVCSREFTRKDHLKRHLLRVHKIDDERLNISKVSLDEQEIENPTILSASLNDYSSHWPDYQEEDDSEPIAIEAQASETFAATNPFSSDDEVLEHHNFNDMNEEDVKQFVETIAHPEISIKEEPNDIIDAYSYDDMDEPTPELKPELIVPEDDEDDDDNDDDYEDEYMANNDDYEDQDQQLFYQPNKILKTDTTPTSTNFNFKYQRNPETNMFHCMECQFEFKLQRNLVRHMLTHTDDRPFTCNLCLKTFKRKDNLQKHLRDVHSEKQFACDKCDKKFATHRQLVRHNQTSRHIKSK